MWNQWFQEIPKNFSNFPKSQLKIGYKNLLKFSQILRNGRFHKFYSDTYTSRSVNIFTQLGHENDLEGPLCLQWHIYLKVSELLHTVRTWEWRSTRCVSLVCFYFASHVMEFIFDDVDEHGITNEVIIVTSCPRRVGVCFHSHPCTYKLHQHTHAGTDTDTGMHSHTAAESASVSTLIRARTNYINIRTHTHIRACTNYINTRTHTLIRARTNYINTRTHTNPARTNYINTRTHTGMHSHTAAIFRLLNNNSNCTFYRM